MQSLKTLSWLRIGCKGAAEGLDCCRVCLFHQGGGLLLPVTESFRLQRFVAHPSKAWCTHGRSSFFTGPDMEHNYVKTR